MLLVHHNHPVTLLLVLCMPCSVLGVNQGQAIQPDIRLCFSSTCFNLKRVACRAIAQEVPHIAEDKPQRAVALDLLNVGELMGDNAFIVCAGRQTAVAG